MDNQWISVEDRLPELYTKVLVLFSKNGIHNYIDIAYREKVDQNIYETDWVWNNIFEKEYVRYWMPFPVIPKGGKNDNTKEKYRD
jgi:hypothetical protein